MNKAMLTIGIIFMAVVGFYSVSVIVGQQTGAELDYYLLKETTEAAMNDAVDMSFYRQFGTVRMDKEKFMESFVKRFSVGVDGTRGYDINVYDINETPPKVSIKITSGKRTNVVKKISDTGKVDVDITTSVDMILEDQNKNNIAIEDQYKTYKNDLKITSVNNIE